jgi:hypothetical protein
VSRSQSSPRMVVASASLPPPPLLPRPSAEFVRVRQTKNGFDSPSARDHALRTLQAGLRGWSVRRRCSAPSTVLEASQGCPSRAITAAKTTAASASAAASSASSAAVSAATCATKGVKLASRKLQKAATVAFEGVDEALYSFDKYRASAQDGVVSGTFRALLKMLGKELTSGAPYVPAPVAKVMRGVTDTLWREVEEYLVEDVVLRNSSASHAMLYREMQVQFWPPAYESMGRSWWHALRAHTVYGLMPGDGNRWSQMRDPWGLVLFLLSINPIWGTSVLLFLLRFFLIDKTDEWQLVSCAPTKHARHQPSSRATSRWFTQSLGLGTSPGPSSQPSCSVSDASWAGIFSRSSPSSSSPPACSPPSSSAFSCNLTRTALEPADEDFSDCRPSPTMLYSPLPIW